MYCIGSQQDLSGCTWCTHRQKRQYMVCAFSASTCKVNQVSAKRDQRMAAPSLHFK